VTCPPPLDIEVRGIRPVKVMQDLREIAPWGFKQKVVVVGHEAVYVNERTISLVSGFQVGEKLFSVSLAPEDLLALIPARSDVVECSWKLNPEGSCHNVRFLSVAYSSLNTIGF